MLSATVRVFSTQAQEWRSVYASDDAASAMEVCILYLNRSRNIASVRLYLDGKNFQEWNRN